MEPPWTAIGGGAHARDRRGGHVLALFIYFTFMLAASKGRSPLLWVVLAIFFPLITIIVLLLIPAKARPPV